MTPENMARNFTGHVGHADHRTVGPHRAWSLTCGEWCYPSTPCMSCQQRMADENPCPHCDGTGIATRPENVDTP